MLTRLLNLISCSCKRTTWPLTKHGRTWVTCVDCGREYGFDLATWERSKKSERPQDSEAVEA